MTPSGEGDPREAGPRAGALSALLQDLARAPDVTEGAAWVAVLKPGERMGKFELVRELGRGGFGVVWEARDLELGRPVAFKAVRSGGQAGVRGERLLREAEAAARLQHPNIVTLHDVGRAEPGPYLVLELLRGMTLAERLAGGPIPPAEAVRIAGEVAKGVAHAHSRGVVHRDLKPENVFLCDEGQVKVLDFGMAHAFGQPKADGGTRGYMAPEQLARAPEDERTDVFALGVILHQMLSGKRPFEDEKALRARGAAPALEVPDEPELGELVGRMLAKDPLARPRNAGEVRDALLALQRPPSGRPPSGPVRVRRRPLLRLGAIVVVGIAAGVLAAVAALWRPATPTPLAGADSRIVVAVADFANETKDPDLDGLSGLLITSLAQSPRLQVLTRSRLFDLVRQEGREPVERIDETLARELGRRAGAKVLLLASIRRFDDVYAVELRALDPIADTYLFTAKEQVPGKRGVPGLVDALAVRTRVALRESEADVRRSGLRVAEAVTGNLEAYRHYFLGIQRIDEYRFEEGRAELAEAIRLDPDFAQPHLQLAMGQLWSWVAPREREAHLAAALSRAERLPETDRLILLAEEALLRGRLDEAYLGYQRAQVSSPSDKRILLRMYWIARFTRQDLVEATSLAERALALDPSWQPAQDALAIALVFRGEFARAEALARAWAERWPSQLTLAVLNGVLLHAARPEEAFTVALKAEATGAPSGIGHLARIRTLIQLDRFEEAEAALRRRTTASPDGLALDRLVPMVALYRGKRREMQRTLDRVQGPGGTPSGAAVFVGAGDADVAGALALARRALPEVPGGSSAAAFAVAGHAEAAAELLEKHVAGLPASSTVLPEAVATIIEALRARDRSDVEGARRILDGLRKGPSRPTSHAASFVLGQICFEAREDACAVEAFDEFQRHHWLFDVSAWAYPRSLLLRASSEERMGRRAEALATVERLLTIWRHADTDLPLLAEAKALRGRLTAAPPAGAPQAAPPP